MKIYLIYKRVECEEQSTLYAFTTKAYIKDRFVEERRKDVFRVREKELSKSLFRSFLSKYKSLELSIKSFETRDLNITGERYKTKYIQFVASYKEELDVFIKSDQVIYEIGKNTTSCAQYFNSELIRALYILLYFDIYKFAKGIYINDSFAECLPYFEFDNRERGYKVDQFMMFLKLFGNTIDYKNLLK